MRSIRELDNVRHAIRRMREVLEEHGERTVSQSLGRDLDRMGSWFATRSVLRSVEASCHPRGLGDNFIPGLSSSAWETRVADLARACARAIEALERLTPEERESFMIDAD